MIFKDFIHNSWFLNIWGLFSIVILLITILTFLLGLGPFTFQSLLPAAVLGVFYIVKKNFSLEIAPQGILISSLIPPKTHITYSHIEALVVRRGVLNRKFNTYQLVIKLNYYPHGFSPIRKANYEFPGLLGDEIIIPSITKETLDQITNAIQSKDKKIEIIQYESNITNYVTGTFMFAFLIVILGLFYLISLLQ